MTLYALLVMKDEARRYLPRVLEFLSEQVDGIFAYDDRSVDGSVEMARAAGAQVAQRPFTVPSFLGHEGQFRSAALSTMAAVMPLKRSDWVVVIDADEFYVPVDSKSPYVDQPYGLLRDEVANAQAHGCTAIHVPILSIWGYNSQGYPVYRTDGLWPTVAGMRLWCWEPGDVFEDKPMGARTTPVRVLQSTQPLYHSGSAVLLHYGFATDGGRQERYDRYSVMVERRPDRLAGHHRDFIESIPEEPTLEPWLGFDPLA